MNRVENLDGLRGLAALWVLVGHCMFLTGYSLPILGKPDLGVDLFILLSGFLMVFQYNIRKEREDWNAARTWAAFWIRRFFRLSPLYFFMLFVAIIAGKAIYKDRVLIDTFLNQAQQKPERYIDGSPENILFHITYLYGLVPSYSFRTPLPDWSLSLEMQFYAIFPLLVLLARKVGWLPAAMGVSIITVGIAFALKRFDVEFPMPAFLPLKMHLFFAGMLIAAASSHEKFRFLCLAIILTAIPFGGPHDMIHLAAREIMIISFFCLIHFNSFNLVSRISNLLGSQPFHWLGELSYGVYLLHLLIMHRVAAWAIDQWGLSISGAARFAIVLTIVAPITYGFAYLMYLLVERPGQKLGRNILALAGESSQAAQTDEEKMAARQ